MNKIKFTIFAMCSFILTACSGGSNGSSGEPLGRVSAKAEARTVIIPGATVVGDLSNHEEMEKLLATIKEQDNLTMGSCNNIPRHFCSKEAPVGTVLGSYEQSYSSFAAIRNNYMDDDGEAIKNMPANSFVALAILPTTNRASIVDATYLGQVSYSTKNNPSISSRELVMNVKGDQISGLVTRIAGTGAVSNVMTFKDATIKAETDRITFNGETIFHKNVFLNEAGTNYTYDTDIQGTYQGMFAGERGEEVIGTFHTNNTEDAYSIQGAFGAKRQ